MQPDRWTPTEARRLNLSDLRDLLMEHKARIEDFVCSANLMSMTPGDPHKLWATGGDGVDSFYVAETAHRHLSERLAIPWRYYTKMHDDDNAWQLLTTNVNHWLAADDRKFMLRTYKREGADGWLRAVLSNSYARMDNEDVLAATLIGIRDAGLNPADVRVDGDLTFNRLRVRITAPSVGVNVGDILGDYRSPFGGGTAADLPMMWAGLEITNSETGHGAFAITPRVVLQVCSNGMTRPMDLTRRTHLGERLDEGVVEWSQETQRRTLELIQSKTRDAVATFLSTDYLDRVAAEMRESAGVTVAQPLARLDDVAKMTGLTQQEQEMVFSDWVASGDSTALGVGHAITATAQRIEDSDRASELEGAFWSIVQNVARAEAVTA